MTLSLSDPLFLKMKWDMLLSPEQEKKYKENATFWHNAQTITITALCVLGAAILVSPYAVTITYSTILTNAFALLPILLPIPGFFYNYFALEAKKASDLAIKIIFCRNEYQQMENCPEKLEIAVNKTFGESLPEDLKTELLKTKNTYPIVLSLINFQENQIKLMEKNKKLLYDDITSYIEKDLTNLSDNPLFLHWKDLIISAQKSWGENKNPHLAIIFLENLSNTIRQENDSSRSQALFQLKKLTYEWRAKEAVPFSKKWAPYFELEKKITAAKIHYFFLWTFLFHPEENLKRVLEQHGLQFENGLSDYSVKVIDLSFFDTAAGKLYNESLVETAIVLPQDRIKKQELDDLANKANILVKLLHTTAGEPKKKTRGYFSFSD